MEGIQWSLETTLEIGAMSVPSKVVRLDPTNRAAISPADTSSTLRLSGLPRHGQEVVDGTIARR